MIRTIRRRAVFATAIALTAALALNGCGEKNASAEGTSPGDSGKPKIVYIPQSVGNSYFEPISDGFREQSGELGFDFEVTGPSDSSATSQLPFIDAAIQQGVDAIAISPNDNEAVVPALKRAMDAGIKVIAVNSDMNPEGRQAAIMPVDFSTLGSFLSELMGSQIDYQGDFAVLSAAATAPSQNEWIDAMKKELADNPKYSDMNLVSVVYGDDDPDKSATVMNGLLTKYPDLAGVIAPTAAGLPAAAQVLSNSPRKGSLALTGLALPNSMKDYLSEGTLSSFGLWDPKQEGIVASYLLMGMIDGSIDTDPGTTFKAPGAELTNMTINDEGQIIAGTTVVFDADNIDEYDF